MENLKNKPILRSLAYTFIPCSMWPVLTCCVMYDGHPRNGKKIDITICLQGGRVLELSQRECVSSMRISDVSNFSEIQIMRNNEGQLFYLLLADHELIVVSSTKHLSIHRRFPNVKRYEVCDPDCSGEAKLKIQTESSTLLVSFDDVQVAKRYLDSTKPAISALEQKLIGAKYNLDRQEESYKRMEKLRQHASFLCYGDEELQLKCSKPIIRFCNKKIVIELEIENLYDECLSKVFVLIHNNRCNSISYTSKVYEHLSTSPFYKETEFREIKSKCKASVVAVIPICEFKNSISSRIDFNVVVSYDRLEKNHLESCDNVQISAADVMGKKFDVFNGLEVDERSMCIAMLSTTDKTKLCIKQKGLGDMISMSTMFCKYLGMHLLKSNAVAIHKNSPFHILHGIMITYEEDQEHIDVVRNEIDYSMDVYSRTPSQVMALIHLMYDKVPLSLVVTTPNIKVTSIDDTEEENGDRKLNFNYIPSATSLLKQSSLTLEYLDNCLSEMNKNKKMNEKDIQIDLFAMGREEFVKYRNKMMTEANNCFELIVKSSAETKGKISDAENIMEID